MTDSLAHDAFVAGHAALARGAANQALKQFLAALAAEPNNTTYRCAMFETLGLLDGYKLPADAVALLSACADDPAIDPTPLPRIARNVLARDPRWDTFAPDAHGNEWFFTSPLLLAGLERATVNDEALEHKLTRIRRHIVIATARDATSDILTSHPRFTAALARHCIATRHIWAEQSDERAALARVLNNTDVAADVKDTLRSLYDPPEAIDATRAREKVMGAALPQLTSISAGVSSAIQAQYERFPYPLWTGVAQNQPLSWNQMTAHFIKAPIAPLPQPDVPSALVAGCGTGRSTAMMATLLPSAKILAVDLSRASLGYAARKAMELKLTNITFGVADILRLGELNRQFHLIECGGVLHHMAEYQTGLKVLAGLLVPGGIMSLALYSERARGPIIAARNFVTEYKFNDDIAGMRAARMAIFELPADHTVRRITRRPDFYSADGLHDLVFNAHEVRFTPATLKPLIASAGLYFLGFNVARASRFADYQQLNPDDPLGRNLDRWDEFEKKYSDTFQGMFQMWLQKPA